MSPDVTADVFEAGIQVAVGTWMTLLAYEVVGANLRARVPWIKNRSMLLKIGGPALIALGLAQGVTAALRTPPSTAPQWQRVSSTDGACSIEFPRAPQHEVKPLGGVPTDVRDAYLEDLDEDFRLSSVDVPAGAPAASDDQRLGAMHDGLIAYANANGQQVLRDERESEHGRRGVRLDTVVNGKHVMRTRIFVAGGRAYRAIVVTPKDVSSEDADRFLASLRFAP